ncbi:MAG: type II toxin-antitoxin system RelE/ParE family toxin [Desulfobacterales bacterium]|nr:type II toxin-antitoxin system RelE/ParE family toxin [Desulfobacterales bacterium]
MAGYRVFFKRSVEKDFGSIPKKDVKRILNRIKTLEDNPRPPGSEKLAGQERYRLRQGRYRIVYSIQDNELTVWVVRVGHRKDIYR